MRKVAALVIASVVLLASAYAGELDRFAPAEPDVELLAEGAFGGSFTFDAATGEMARPGGLRSGVDVYSNLSPPGTPNVVFGLAELDTVFGDQLFTTDVGTVNELALTVYNSDAGNDLPITTMNVEVTVHRDADNSLIGEFSADIDFGAGLNPGFFAVVTFTNLVALATPIVTDTTAIRVEQQRISHTGGSNRMGVASLMPIQIGSSPDTMLFNGALFGFIVPCNPGYRVSVIPDSPCPGDLDGDNDVDLSDLAQLLANYGATSGANPEDGDMDGDGDVDLSDLAALLAVYGTTCT